MNQPVYIFLKSRKEPLEDYYPDESSAKSAIARITNDVSAQAGMGAVTTPSGAVSFEVRDFSAATLHKQR
jgi:hypothetical protein